MRKWINYLAIKIYIENGYLEHTYDKFDQIKYFVC